MFDSRFSNQKFVLLTEDPVKKLKFWSFLQKFKGKEFLSKNFYRKEIWGDQSFARAANLQSMPHGKKLILKTILSIKKFFIKNSWRLWKKFLWLQKFTELNPDRTCSEFLTRKSFESEIAIRSRFWIDFDFQWIPVVSFLIENFIHRTFFIEFTKNLTITTAVVSSAPEEKFWEFLVNSICRR